MIGKRIPDRKGEDGLLQPGEYGKIDGTWHACAPRTIEHPLLAHGFFLANLSRHDVTEHADGTITVSPSILVTMGQWQWHGYLEHGVWREV